MKVHETIPAAVKRDLPPGAQVTTDVPARPPTFVSDVVVPLAQALVSGALVAGVIVYLMGEVVPWLEVNPAKVWMALALAIAGTAWALLLLEHRRHLWLHEVATGEKLPEPAANKRTLEVVIKTGNFTQLVGAEWLEVDDAELIKFAQGLSETGNLTEGRWAKGTFAEGINKFRAVRGKMEQAGLVANRTPKAKRPTYTLTKAGHAFVRRIAEYSHTLTHDD